MTRTDTRPNRKISLLVISFLGLFLELALIRWLPSNVLSLAYFSNIVLISAFLGFGLGCLMTRRRSLLPSFPIMLLVAVGAFLSFRFFEVVVPTGESEWIWSGYAANRLVNPSVKLGIVPTLVGVFVLGTVVFIPIGQTMGKLMETFRPIQAYTLNIVGSLLGIVAFGALSFTGGVVDRPVVWFGLVGLLTTWFFVGKRRLLFLALACCAAVVLIVGLTARPGIWSPYYNINTTPRDEGMFDVYVNNFLHQHALNFSTHRPLREKYSLPYRFKKPEKVLILGAGTGNDVAIANLERVAEITAVEIDPEIARLGRERHPLRPYDSETVRLVIDDARSFLRRTDERFDMIVFGTLDSQAVLSGMSSVRLDNFVYTVECFRDAQRLLAPDGLAVLMFSVPSDWLASKLLTLTFEVFPEPAPIVRVGEPFPFNLMAIAGPGLTDDVRRTARKYGFRTMPSGAEGHELPTDDWPYLYLNKRSIPGHYLKGVLVLAAISIVPILILSPGRIRGPDLSFLSLGCAFMLLETKSVTTLSLLHGSTWVVNAFVFGAILSMILVANLLVQQFGIRRVEWAYLGLFGALLLNYLLPASSFLGQGYWIRTVGSSLVIALPILFAGIVFATLFSATKSIGFAFGSNLIGAVLGGFLEYGSMKIGLNNLYLVAGLFYLVSLVVVLRRRSA